MKIEILEKAIKDNNVEMVRKGLDEAPEFANGILNGYLLFQTAVYQLKLKDSTNPIQQKKTITDRMAIIKLFIDHGANSLNVVDNAGFNIFQIALYRACYLYNDIKSDSALCHLETARMIYNEAKLKNDQIALQKMQSSVNQLLTTQNGKLVGKKHNLFHMAVYFGYYQALELILELKPDITLSNEFGLTHLHLAILAYAYAEKLDENFANAQDLAEQKKVRYSIVKRILDYIIQSSQENPELDYLKILKQPWNGTWPVINDPFIFGKKYYNNNPETPLNIATREKCTDLVDLLNEYFVKVALQPKVDACGLASSSAKPQLTSTTTILQAVDHIGSSAPSVIVVPPNLQPSPNDGQIAQTLSTDIPSRVFSCSSEDSTNHHNEIVPSVRPTLQRQNSDTKIYLPKQIRRFASGNASEASTAVNNSSSASLSLDASLSTKAIIK